MNAVLIDEDKFFRKMKDFNPNDIYKYINPETGSVEYGAIILSQSEQLEKLKKVFHECIIEDDLK